MNAYERLCACLKIVVANLYVLHHNLLGGNWFGDHERLGDYYDKIGDMADAVIERGLSIGYREPSIAEAVTTFADRVITGDSRDARESYSLVQGSFRTLAAMMDEAMPITPPDVQNKLQEWQYYLNLEAAYKLARELEQAQPAKPPEPDDDDD